MRLSWRIWLPNMNTAAHSLYEHCKFPIYSDTPTNCCNHSKVWTMWLYHRVMSPNDADGMANSVDPNQTARKLRIITVIKLTSRVDEGECWCMHEWMNKHTESCTPVWSCIVPCWKGLTKKAVCVKYFVVVLKALCEMWPPMIYFWLYHKKRKKIGYQTILL